VIVLGKTAVASQATLSNVVTAHMATSTANVTEIGLSDQLCERSGAEVTPEVEAFGCRITMVKVKVARRASAVDAPRGHLDRIKENDGAFPVPPSAAQP
jgi:hypothetical protein